MKYRNIFITKNTPFSKTFSVNSSDGTPTNLTGYTGSMFIAKHHESTTKYTGTVEVTDATNGQIKASLTGTSTALLPVGTLVYSIFLTPPAGDEFLLVQGECVVEPTIHP